MLGIALALCAAFGAALLLFRKGRFFRQYPPGPRSAFLVGNLLQMPARDFPLWLYFMELKEKYGDIVHLSTLGKPLIVLGSFAVARDLLVTRSAIYSDRPRIVMGGEMVELDRSMTLMHPGPKYVKTRKAFHQLLNKKTVLDFQHQIELEIRLFIGRLIGFPEDCFSHVKFLVGKLILQITYGVHITSPDDSHLVTANRAEYIFDMALEQGMFLVDILPILRYVPGWFPFAGFKKLAAKWRVEHFSNMYRPFEHVLKEMANGTAEPSLASRSLTDLKGMDDDARIRLCGTMYGAGFETTVPSICNFILAMVLHPEILRKAQVEMDLVVGPTRLPTWADKEQLPYLECIIKEVMRWRPVVPLSVPYSAMSDDEYNGYHIPKGSTVFLNAWAISRDPEMYPEPEDFVPERFEGHPEVLDPRQYVFGMGRRICPGMPLAELVMWTTLAMLISTTEMSKPFDDQGREIIPPTKFSAGLVSSPNKFKFAICHRTSAVDRLLSEATIA